ncbi:hypothetical protein V8G54_026250 [Vigna mungo]|uniref:Uncharacterized protein n=1 Tax=Vigna mungo TaxID=3915 RepID=A0AAQ3RQB9_VIGMU
MEALDLDEGMKVLDACLTNISWRLKPSSKRRLQLDMLALITRMRPVVMVDYGGIMPQLQHHLSSLLQHAQKFFFQESLIFEHIRLMVIQDMIYLIHLTELTHFLNSTFNSHQPLLFVDLQSENPKMVTKIEESQLAMQLVSIQRLFLTIFSPEGTTDPSPSQDVKCTDETDTTCQSQRVHSRSTNDCIDLSDCMDNTDITHVDSANSDYKDYAITVLCEFSSYAFCFAIVCIAISVCSMYIAEFVALLAWNATQLACYDRWLLGYPVVYLFGKEHIADAIYNLSTKYLHIFQVFVCSFSVPYDLSMRGSNEQWAEAFLTHMQAKWERCASAWKSLKMEKRVDTHQVQGEVYLSNQTKGNITKYPPHLENRSYRTVTYHMDYIIISGIYKEFRTK